MLHCCAPGRRRQGWRFFVGELGKAVAFFDHSYGSGIRGAIPQRPIDGVQAIGAGEPSSSTTSKVLSLEGSYVHSLGSGSRGKVPR